MSATVPMDGAVAFARVVELGSFTAAARESGVPTSTVSRQVQRLEESLGVQLLLRTTRKVSLTDAGVAFHRRVGPALGALEEAASLIRGLAVEPSGTLRVSCPVSFAAFARLIAGFVAAYPKVEVDLVATNRFVDLVGEGFDAAIRTGELRDSSLIAKKLAESERWLVAAPRYLESAPAIRRASDLERHACVRFSTAHGSKWRLIGPRGEVEVPVGGPVRADDISFCLSAAASGAGIAFLPSMFVAEAIADGRLVRVLPRFASRKAPVHLVYPSRRHQPAKLRVFRDFIAANMGLALGGASPALARGV
ncbi:MAG: LysR family transcriptional regulator [Deltaproteobacteria bacterium]|nr:LysR family transcriptional regulator [Deltaproteobacteria bacterium]